MPGAGKHGALGAESLLENSQTASRRPATAQDESSGYDVAASASSGMSASIGDRSAIAARAPCSSSGGSGSGPGSRFRQREEDSTSLRGPAARAPRTWR
jgi:hypothetical protein